MVVSTWVATRCFLIGNRVAISLTRSTIELTLELIVIMVYALRMYSLNNDNNEYINQYIVV